VLKLLDEAFAYGFTITVVDGASPNFINKQARKQAIAQLLIPLVAQRVACRLIEHCGFTLFVAKYLQKEHSTFINSINFRWNILSDPHVSIQEKSACIKFYMPFCVGAK